METKKKEKEERSNYDKDISIHLSYFGLTLRVIFTRPLRLRSMPVNGVHGSIHGTGLGH